jgi:hypothetical protein
VLAVLCGAWATAGTGEFKVNVGYYDLMADGFLKGHLYLDVAPPPALLALEDPYDPAQNGNLRLHDASLYNGHYYLYWGPAPAILHLIWRVATGQQLPESVVQVAAAVAGGVAYWLLLEYARARYLRAVPRLLVACCAFALALGGISPYLLGRPIIYHEPLTIACATLFFSWYLFLRGADQANHSRLSYWLMSGSLLGVAIASRITYLGYAIGFGVAGLALIGGSRTGKRLLTTKQLLVFALPVAVTGILLGAYNFLRFGSPTDFGIRYVLQGSESTYQLGKLGYIGDAYFNPQYLAFNLAIYLASWPQLEPASVLMPQFQPVWPYIHWTGLSVPTVNGIQQFIIDPPIVSLPVLAPVVLFCPVAAWWAWKRGMTSSIFLLVVGLILGGACTLAIVASTRGATARYSADFAPAFGLVGSLGLLVLAHAAVGLGWTLRAVVVVIATLVLTASLFVGSLLGTYAWKYIYPKQAGAVAVFSRDTAAQLQVLIAPGSITSSIRGGTHQSWETNDGRYVNQANIMLRAPQDAPALMLGIIADGPGDSNIQVLVNTVPVARKSLGQGFNAVVVDVLTHVTAGQVLRIQLQLDGTEAVGPGSPLPLKLWAAQLSTRLANATAFFRQPFQTTNPDVLGLPVSGGSLPAETKVALRGISGDWITSAGIDMLLPELSWRGATCIDLVGNSSLGVLPARPDVKAVLRSVDAEPAPLSSRFEATQNNAYRIRIELPDRNEPLGAPAIVHLGFSTFFVPAKMGINGDTRELVVMKPVDVRIASGSCRER